MNSTGTPVVAALEPERLGQRGGRLGGQLRRHPRGVGGIGHPQHVRHLEPTRQQRRVLRVDSRRDHGLRRRLADDVGDGFAVFGPERVEVHNTREALRYPVGDGGDHHAAVAVTNQDDLAQVFELDHRHDVGDVGLEIQVVAVQVGALTQSGQRRSEHVVATRAQAVGDPLPGPSAVPTAGDEQIGRHGARLRRTRRCSAVIPASSYAARIWTLASSGRIACGGRLWG